MTEIMEVAKYIRKEIQRADDYAYEANKHKMEFPEMAQHYYKAAQEHLTISDTLHAGALKLIENAKRSGAIPSDAMKRVWEFEHEMMMDEKAIVLRKLDMFKS